MSTLIHIGMGKAGSTSLQRNIFEKVTNINYLTIIDKVVIDILYLNSFEFKNKYLENPSTLNTTLNKQSTIISCESLSFFGDQFIICDRLRQIFNNEVTILFIIRNQFDLIQSLYLERLAGGVYVSFNTFLKQQFLNHQISMLPKLNYYNLIKYYKNTFDCNNVKVILFEELFQNQSNANIEYEFFKEKFNINLKLIKDFKRENKSIPSQLVPLKCLSNYLFRYDGGLGRYDIGTRGINEKRPKRSIQYIKKQLSNRFFKNRFFSTFFKKKPLSMSDENKNMILKYFSNSNKKLENEYNLNLKINNYPVN
tara:strand:- start:147 stop:1076 length:930 start_codon:yes stop_codon:yes gene_type:complete